MVFQNTLDQIRGRRLAVRSGDADHLHPAARRAEEHVRQQRHGEAAVAYHDLRELQIQPALDHKRRRSGRSRLRRIIMPVNGKARQADEHVARLHLPGIDLQIGNFCAAVTVQARGGQTGREFL
ncbi:hypothetical protein D3C72_2135660 [compost metagenome]